MTPEQLEIVQEMESNGETDIMPSEIGTLKTCGAYNRLESIDIDIRYNPNANYDVESFIEQVQLQEDGLNNLTISNFMNNYEKRINNGRSLEGTKAQNQYNDSIKAVLINEKMQEGISPEKAEKEVAEELKGMVALHNPDQIVGGNPNIINARGNANVNSALGSLWRHGRAEKLYKEVSKIAENMTLKEKDTTYLDVRFHIHSD